MRRGVGRAAPPPRSWLVHVLLCALALTAGVAAPAAAAAPAAPAGLRAFLGAPRRSLTPALPPPPSAAPSAEVLLVAGGAAELRVWYAGDNAGGVVSEFVARAGDGADILAVVAAGTPVGASVVMRVPGVAPGGAATRLRVSARGGGGEGPPIDLVAVSCAAGTRAAAAPPRCDRCPVSAACDGGAGCADSSLAGPLCTDCAPGHYRTPGTLTCAWVRYCKPRRGGGTRHSLKRARHSARRACRPGGRPPWASRCSRSWRLRWRAASRSRCRWACCVSWWTLHR